ncbi:type II toxin-antitoxin system Phd/YefM family antitoxin [Enterococcus casseliflavus]|uniref:type II toxin-antitoxin system Phd/YefM family antitoxin n=1 Tax=Enterococcus TaxID=1350 RepID=UPI0014332307|nr:type II toxin-antitoxin system Phd/YefM family antitoxin [Enterococcus casseliflavus]NKD32197.1 type II toxin-antitoxin system Phd/YefM family antitoxin [Enterococcus casseliflavus]
MANTLGILTVTDLKKSPKSIFAESKSRKEAVVIYNNNVAEGVVMDVNTFNNIENEIELLNEKIFDLETFIRLQDNEKLWTDEEVRGGYEFSDLSKIDDEWT